MKIPQAALDYWVTVSPDVRDLLERFRLHNLYTCAFHEITSGINYGLPQMSLCIHKGLFCIYFVGWSKHQLFVRVLNPACAVIHFEPVSNLDEAYISLQRGLAQLDIVRVVALRAN